MFFEYSIHYSMFSFFLLFSIYPVFLFCPYNSNKNEQSSSSHSLDRPEEKKVGRRDYAIVEGAAAQVETAAERRASDKKG